MATLHGLRDPLSKMLNLNQAFQDSCLASVTQAPLVYTNCKGSMYVVDIFTIIYFDHIQIKNLLHVIHVWRENNSKSSTPFFPFRYYSALKTMEQLENICFPRVSQYRFCQIMIENLPKLREEIKEISMSDLKDFLESIRKHSDKIGETAMKQVHLTSN